MSKDKRRDEVVALGEPEQKEEEPVSESVQVYDPIEESSMSLMEHLVELRVRLMWVVGALVVGTLIAFIFTFDLIDIINAPLTELGIKPQALGPTDSIVVFFKVGFTAGAALAMPVLLYQLVSFVAPGLYPKEKRMLWLMLPGAMVLFVIGAAFSFFFMLPVGVQFLATFAQEQIEQDWAVDRYYGLVTRVVFWIGVAFETPLVMAFLARIGLVSGRQLLGWWRQSIVVAAIVAAMITPTIDPVNMAVVMGPLIVLYFLSVGLAYLLYKPRTPRDFSD